MDNIKKLFSLAKRRSLIYFSLLMAIIFALPLKTYAAIMDQVVGALMIVPNLALNLIFQALLDATEGLVSLSSWLLTWVTSDNFISLTYTTRANPVIEAGLNVTQSFVNMGIVLALIFIAFAMILRIKGYETIRIFITLIAVALLVNFAPLLCGLIVDASNIAMHYFTKNITGMTGLANVLGSYTQTTGALIKNALSLSGQSQILIKSCVMISINLGVFFALLMFVFIFMLRYIAIWVIVILSPLAFVAYILPLTRKYAFQWFSQLIQWSFIGVIAAFFLYLSEQIFAKMEQLKDSLGASPVPSESGSDALDVGFFNDIFPYFVPLAFLIIGIVLSLKTSAAGADVITKTAKNIGTNIQKTGRKFAGEEAKNIYNQGLKKLRENVPEKAKEKMQKFGYGSSELIRLKLGENKTGLMKGAGRFVSSLSNWGTAIPRYALRGIGKAGSMLQKYDTRDIKNVKEQVNNQTFRESLADLRGNKPWIEKAAILEQLQGNGKANDLRDNGFGNEEQSKIATQALKRGHKKTFKTIMKNNSTMVDNVKDKIKDSPELQKEADLEVTTKDREKGITNSVEKIMYKMGPADVENMDDSSFKDPRVLASMLKFWKGKHIAKAGEKFGEKFSGPFQEAINGIEIKKPDWLKDNNSALYKYLNNSPGAQTLGMGVPSAEERSKHKVGYKKDYNNNRGMIDAIVSNQPVTPGGPPKPTSKKVSSRFHSNLVSHSDDATTGGEGANKRQIK